MAIDGSSGDAPVTPGSGASRAVYRSTRHSRRAARAGSRTTAQRWRRRILGGLAGLLVAVPLTGGAGWWYVNYRLDQAHRVTITPGLLHHSKPGAPFNVLLIGSDSRQFAGSTPSRFGSSSVVTGQRSDVIIIARIVPKTRQVYLLSIPRDLWVDIPGNVQYISGENRINAAFNSGPSLLIETLKKDLGIPVDHFAEINFQGFQNMVQAVGGIRIDFPNRIEDPYTGLSIQHTGCQLISGGMSLAFVRSRHLVYYADGQWNEDYGSDWSRIRRQDVFFRALLDQVKSKLGNLLDMNSLLTATVHNLTLDSTMTNSFLINLGLEFRHVGQGSIHTEVLPTIPDTLPSGADVLLEAKSYDTAMIRSFLAIGTKAASKTTSTTTSTVPGTASTSTSTTTTTAPASSSDVVFDTQPEPWNGTPC